MGSLPAIDPNEAFDSPDSPGPEGEFEQVYRRHYPLIQRYVRRRLGAGSACEDVVAETFLVAYENYHRYEDRGLPVRAWLYRLATSRLARLQRRVRGTASKGQPELEVDPEQDRERAAEQAAVRAALARLPRRWQDVLALHYLEGLPVDQVADVVGCRPGTVKSRLSRGREALRRELEREDVVR